MKLKNKFFVWSALLIVSVIILGTASVWNLYALGKTSQAEAAEYDVMDRADAAAVQVAWLRDSLRGAESQTYRQAAHFTPISNEVQEIVRELKLAARVDDGDAGAEVDLGKAVDEHLNAALSEAATAEHANDPAAANGTRRSAAELEQVRQSLSAVARLMPASARRHVNAASDHLARRISWTCVLLAFVLVISFAIHVIQFRTLVRPLVWLRDDMRRSSAENYREQVRQRGDREFQEVAHYFNGLARELAGLYRSLEDKVIARSRELVRSERLASVGFLAAGVAHEINNPLSVISGYAELAASSIRRLVLGPAPTDDAAGTAEAEAEALAGALDAQQIICDEAFRCKEITSRLLSLARGNGEGRESLCMDEVARQVTVLTKGLKNYRNRRVILDFAGADRLEVVANPTEMKQVLLNLTVNALEAVPAALGEVRIGGRRTGEWVELSVEDNGKGMSAETLQHVFEPFFTAKRGAGEPGTGLGLSITHAIVENHGGRIRAESSGPGHGSRFTIRLPARAGTSAAPLVLARNRG